MAWQMSRRNQDHVKTQLEIGMLGMGYEPALRGVDDSGLLARRHCKSRLIEAGAGFHLDKGDEVAPPRDDVDLAMRRAETFCEDPIAFGHQKGRCTAFRRKSGAKCGDPFGGSDLFGPI